MFSHFHQTYFWPLKAAQIASWVHSCPHCARNNLRLIRRMKPLRLLPEKQHIDSFAIDLLGPFPKTNAGSRFIFLVAKRFPKLTSVFPLKRKAGLDISKAF